MTKINPKIEKEIERFIKYIRRMNSITDDTQLEFLLQACYSRNQDSYTSIGIDIPGHIKFIREMSRKTDDKIRQELQKQYEWDFTIQDIFENSSKRVAIREMTDAAKDMKSNPKTFARKVDQEFRR